MFNKYSNLLVLFVEFKLWKRKEEIATCCQYVAIRGAIRLANNRLKKEFVCHRSGFVKRQVDPSQSIRRHCSYKLNATCPASIEAILNADGSVHVTFYRSHADHSKEIKYLTISREERAVIGVKLAEGRSFNEILEYIRSLSDTSELSARLLLFIKLDVFVLCLRNVQIVFQIFRTYAKRSTQYQKLFSDRP